jgi:hypothetical protein
MLDLFLLHILSVDFGRVNIGAHGKECKDAHFWFGNTNQKSFSNHNKILNAASTHVISLCQDDKNHKDWAAQMKPYLMLQGIFPIISGKEDADSSTYDVHNEETTGALVLKMLQTGK